MVGFDSLDAAEFVESPGSGMSARLGYVLGSFGSYRPKYHDAIDNVSGLRSDRKKQASSAHIKFHIRLGRPGQGFVSSPIWRGDLFRLRG